MIGSESRRWMRSAFLRRVVLALLIVAPTLLATTYMASVLPHEGGTFLEKAMVAVFAALFAWISIGFWTAVIGFVVLLVGRNPYALSRLCRDVRSPLPEAAATAILIPIYNEEMGRVLAGVRSVWESLGRTGQREHFHLFLLSDTRDVDRRLDEERHWARLRAELGAEGSLFYRNRRNNRKRKSGNVADFCRRWGKAYRYMVVFDADSVMAGATLVRLVQMMERSPDAGMIQTVPMPVNHASPLARMQQFSAHLYGPLFAAGLHFWQLGDAQYWGHNVIIRTEPFMKHCALPELSGKPPLGGDILSHDFVESALMRRAGWGVWLAYDLDGSWEETPPTVLDEMKRDRRWCQGNLQHLRLLFAKGLFPAYRILFVNGAMSYVSALLWLLFIVLGSVEALAEVFLEPTYFGNVPSLFPQWPVWYARWAVALLASTAVILFLPKVLSVLLALVKKRTASFGGTGPMLASVLAESLAGTLLAPVRMLFHSRFVFVTLLGRNIGWDAQDRGDRGIPWADALAAHGIGTVVALLWGLLLFVFNRAFFWWLSPILAGLVLGAPLSVYTSRPSIGGWLRRHRLLLIPEEIAPPRELEELAAFEKAWLGQEGRDPLEGLSGFARTVVDPVANALRRSLVRRGEAVLERSRRKNLPLLEKALHSGPRALSGAEKKRLIDDPVGLSELHRRLWAEGDLSLWLGRRT